MTLVDEWRRAWRWFSVQAMAMAAAVQAAWAALPDDMRARIPGWIATAATVALLVAGIAGRLVRQRQ